MGPGYANEVFYSFLNGKVAEAPRAGWDIAFHTELWSATILINEGVGVALWNYPNADTNGWATIDTSGILGWKALNNNHTLWDDGAFNRYSTGHPDYGWGVYNMVNHNVIGDSIQIIKTESGTYKKLRIIKKISVANTFIFRFANLDGTDEQTITFDANPYTTKNLVGYSIDNKQVVDFEPAKDSWDLRFTKYMSVNTGQPYLVTGVLTNWALESAKAYPVLPGYNDWSILDLSNVRDKIGYDWKTFDMGTFTYLIEDSLIFFVKDIAGNMNNLVFTKFEGSSSGKFVFEKQIVSATGIPTTSKSNYTIWPNPASNELNINLTGNESGISIFDIAGRLVFSQILDKVSGNTSISLVELKAGVYFLKIQSPDHTATIRFIHQ